MKKLVIFFAITLVTISSLFLTASATDSNIPEWVKNTAKWYGDDKISETEFLNAIKFLVDNNIITLDSNTDLTNSFANQESATVIIPNGNVGQSNKGFYLPLNLEVQKGTIVEWINDDNVGHTIQSQDGEGNVVGLFNSDVLQTSEKFSYKFEESDVYNYFCTIHPWRVGVITVKLKHERGELDHDFFLAVRQVNDDRHRERERAEEEKRSEKSHRVLVMRSRSAR